MGKTGNVFDLSDDERREILHSRIYRSLRMNVDRVVIYSLFVLFACRSLGVGFRMVYVLTLLLANWSCEVFMKKANSEEK